MNTPNESSKNRYSFHAIVPDSNQSKSGVDSEFVHEQLIVRIAGLLDNSVKAASINPNFIATKEGVSLLGNCLTVIEQALQTQDLKASNNRP